MLRSLQHTAAVDDLSGLADSHPLPEASAQDIETADLKKALL